MVSGPRKRYSPAWIAGIAQEVDEIEAGQLGVGEHPLPLQAAGGSGRRRAGRDGDQPLRARVALVGPLQLPPRPGRHAGRHQEQEQQDAGRRRRRCGPPWRCRVAGGLACASCHRVSSSSGVRPALVPVQGLLEQDLGGHRVEPVRLAAADRPRPRAAARRPRRWSAPRRPARAGSPVSCGQRLAEAAHPLGGRAAPAVEAARLAEHQPARPPRGARSRRSAAAPSGRCGAPGSRAAPRAGRPGPRSPARSASRRSRCPEKRVPGGCPVPTAHGRSCSPDSSRATIRCASAGARARRPATSLAVFQTGERHGRRRHLERGAHAHRRLPGRARRPAGARSGRRARSPPPSSARASTPGEIQQVNMGCVLPAGQGQAPARQAALAAGCPPSTGAHHPQQGLRLGHAGGDDRRQRPALRRLRGRRRGRHGEHEPGALPRRRRPRRAPPRPRQADRLDDPRRPVGPLQRRPHGQLRRDSAPPSTSSAARSRTPTRCESYRRAREATEKGLFAEEIVPVADAAEEGRAAVVDRDEEPFKVDLDKMATLQARLREGRHGDRRQRQQDQRRRRRPGAHHRRRTPRGSGVKPLARIVAHATAAQEPEWFTTAPVGAVRAVLERAGLQGASDIDLWEVNEAFAVVAMAFHARPRPRRRAVNVRGGAVALGHPDRRLRRPHPGHPAARPARARRPARLRRHLHRRRRGYRDDRRAPRLAAAMTDCSTRTDLSGPPVWLLSGAAAAPPAAPAARARRPRRRRPAPGGPAPPPAPPSGARRPPGARAGRTPGAARRRAASRRPPPGTPGPPPAAARVPAAPTGQRRPTASSSSSSSPGAGRRQRRRQRRRRSSTSATTTPCSPAASSIRYQDIDLTADKAEIDLVDQGRHRAGQRRHRPGAAPADRRDRRRSTSTARPARLTQASGQVRPRLLLQRQRGRQDRRQHLRRSTDGIFTSCNQEVPDWSFRLRQAHGRGRGLRPRQRRLACAPRSCPSSTRRTSSGRSRASALRLADPQHRLLGPPRRLARPRLLPDPRPELRHHAPRSTLHARTSWGSATSCATGPTDGTRGDFIGYVRSDDPGVRDEWRWKMEWNHITNDLPLGHARRRPLPGLLGLQLLPRLRARLRPQHPALHRQPRLRHRQLGRPPRSTSWSTTARPSSTSRRHDLQRRLPEIEYRLRSTRLARTPFYLQVDSSRVLPRPRALRQLRRAVRPLRPLPAAHAADPLASPGCRSRSPAASA